MLPIALATLLSGCCRDKGLLVSVQLSGPLYPDSYLVPEVEIREGARADLQCRWYRDDEELAEGECALDGQEVGLAVGDQVSVEVLGYYSECKADSIESEVVKITPAPVMAVTEMIGGTLAFLDTSTGQIDARLDLTLTPEEAGIDGESGATEGRGMPMHVLHSPEGDSLWVTSSYYGVIWEIDPATRQVLDWVDIANQIYWIVFDETGETFWTPEMDDGGVLHMDRNLSGGQVDMQAITELDYEETGAVPVTLTRDERGWLYVPHHKSPWLSILDTNGDEFEDVNQLNNVDGGYWAEVGPAGKYLWVVSEGDDALLRYDVDDLEDDSPERETVEMADLPNFIHFDPDGEHAYVTSFHDSVVSYVNIKEMEVESEIETALGSVGIIPRPDGRYLYVTNVLGKSITVIDTVTNEVVDDLYGLNGPRWVEWLEQ